MKVLLIVKQKKNVDTFLGTIRALLDRGHTVTLAVQERPDARLEQYATETASPRFALISCPPLRTDGWADVAPLLRSVRDCLHYQRPALRSASKLQARTVDKLREDLRVEGGDEQVAGMLRAIPVKQVQHLDRILELAEERLPTDALYDEFLRAEHPDVVLLSPLVHFGSAQADLVASARALGIPVGMLLFSWDNLSTKGRLHIAPDWMFVWNERQRLEAGTLHDFPESRAVVVGAPRFDSFFSLGHQMTREEFLRPLGLDPSTPALLYVCSSPFVSATEIAFIRKWLAALRASPSRELSTCNVIVRPHPDVALLDPDEGIEELRWPSLRGMKGFISRPFADARAIVLRTADRAQQGLYECIGHSAAVVGLNTSAELEAAIVGRPVYTVLAGEADADGQGSTLHFYYLLEEHGGPVRVAGTLDEHTAQLAGELASPSDPAPLRAFVGGFLRPLGADRPVAPLLAEAIERTFAGVAPHPVEAAAGTGPALDLEATPLAHAAMTPVTVGKRRSSIQVYAPATASQEAPRLDRTTVRWLQDHVRIGEVLVDATAGVGLYSVFAAKHRGAVVIAFEPGYAAFKQLCDHLLLNGCDGAVMAVPLALADVDGPGELKFPADGAGGARHAQRRASWRQKRPARDGRTITQPVCVTSLDAALERYEWPAPNHLRLSGHSLAASVLDGATRALASDALRTMFLTLPEEECAALTARLTPRWLASEQTPISRGRAHLLLSRADVS